MPECLLQSLTSLRRVKWKSFSICSRCSLTFQTLYTFRLISFEAFLYGCAYPLAITFYCASCASRGLINRSFRDLTAHRRQRECHYGLQMAACGVIRRKLPRGQLTPEAKFHGLSKAVMEHNVWSR